MTVGTNSRWRFPKIVAEPARKTRFCVDCPGSFVVWRENGGRKRCIACAALRYRRLANERRKRQCKKSLSSAPS